MTAQTDADLRAAVAAAQSQLAKLATASAADEKADVDAAGVAASTITRLQASWTSCQTELTKTKTALAAAQQSLVTTTADLTASQANVAELVATLKRLGFNPDGTWIIPVGGVIAAVDLGGDGMVEE